ncbi:hypothetical protein L083_6246 [Actinoplanes sp. N902-109]|nr:hypothetical protein L083_6246 [Actinoplanes sp. N902-109]
MRARRHDREAGGLGQVLESAIAACRSIHTPRALRRIVPRRTAVIIASNRG